MNSLIVHQRGTKFPIFSQTSHIDRTGNIEIGFSGSNDNKIVIHVWNKDHKLTSLFYQVDDDYKVSINGF